MLVERIWLKVSCTNNVSKQFMLLTCVCAAGMGSTSSGTKQLYYGDYRYRYQFPWTKRSVTTSVKDMEKMEEEDRVSVRRKLSSETGFTGKSILHCLYSLYKFDVLQDCVFDVMHSLLLGVIKRHLVYYRE